MHPSPCSWCPLLLLPWRGIPKFTECLSAQWFVTKLTQWPLGVYLVSPRHVALFSKPDYESAGPGSNISKKRQCVGLFFPSWWINGYIAKPETELSTEAMRSRIIRLHFYLYFILTQWFLLKVSVTAACLPLTIFPPSCNLMFYKMGILSHIENCTDIPLFPLLGNNIEKDILYKDFGL